MNPKCLGTSLPDTFSARSAHLTGLKMIRITRAVSSSRSFDDLVGAGGEPRRHLDRKLPGGFQIEHHSDVVDACTSHPASQAKSVISGPWNVAHERLGRDHHPQRYLAP